MGHIAVQAVLKWCYVTDRRCHLKFKHKHQEFIRIIWNFSIKIFLTPTRALSDGYLHYCNKVMDNKVCGGD